MRPYGWGHFGATNGIDTGDRIEIHMAGPPNHSFTLFDENTGREGYVLDANCIAWMFNMSVDPDVILDIMKFIPEVVWHSGIQSTPLEKLYDTVLECFEQSSGHPVVSSKCREKAYVSAKALLHVTIHRKCMGGTESDKEALDSISRRHQFIGSWHYEGDSDLESALGMMDRIFRPDNPGQMNWHKSSLSVPHHTWLAQVLLYHTWASSRKATLYPTMSESSFFTPPHNTHSHLRS